MKKVYAALMIFALVSACGSSGEGTAPAAKVSLLGGVATGGAVVAVSGEFLDITTGSTASGASGGPEVLAEMASSTCRFDLSLDNGGEGSARTHRFTTNGATTGEIKVVQVAVENYNASSGQAACVANDGNPDNCIWCATTEGESCMFACDGIISANAMNASDSFDVKIDATHQFKTELGGDGYGMVRMDGYADDGTISIFGNAAVTFINQTFNRVTCDGGDPDTEIEIETLASSTLTGLTNIDGDNYDANYSNGDWHEFVKIVSSTGSLNAPRWCTISDHVILRFTLPASITQNDSIDLSFGATNPIKLSASLCANQSTCAKHVW